MSNTHSVVIPGFAFINGVPDTCNHNWNGDTIFFTKSGKMITPHTFPEWASYTAQMREPLIHKHQQEIDDPILEGAVSCSICKKVFQPDLR